jgi:hypothetical protein
MVKRIVVGEHETAIQWETCLECRFLRHREEDLLIPTAADALYGMRHKLSRAPVGVNGGGITPSRSGKGDHPFVWISAPYALPARRLKIDPPISRALTVARRVPQPWCATKKSRDR